MKRGREGRQKDSRDDDDEVAGSARHFDIISQADEDVAAAANVNDDARTRTRP